MPLGRLIERLFVQVQADLSQLSSQLKGGVTQTAKATQSMAKQWEVVSASIERMTDDLKRGKITQGLYMAQMNRHASAVAALSGSYRQAQTQVHAYASSLKRASIIQQTAMNPVPVQAFTRSVGMARMQMMNLGFQVNDIGQTLATGMNPMTVMIQQGSQILQIYAGQGGVKTALGDISRILVGIGKKVWPLAVIAAGFAMITREIGKTTEVSVSFMDTTKAVFQVAGAAVMRLIGGPLTWLGEKFGKVLDFIAEWFPKIMNNVVGITVLGVKTLGAVWGLLPGMWQDTWTAIKNTVIDVSSFIINIFKVHLPKWASWGANKLVQALVAGFRAVRAVWDQLPDLMKSAIGGAVNWVVDGVEKLVNSAIDGINKLISGLQSILDFVGADSALQFFGFSGQLPEIGESDLSEWRMKTSNAPAKTGELIAKEVGKTFSETFIEEVSNPDFRGLDEFKGAYRGAFEELGRQVKEITTQSLGTDFMGGLFEGIQTQAIENALSRVANNVEGIGGAARSAAKEIKEVTDQLNKGLTTSADNLAGVFGNAFERLAKTGKLTFRGFVQDMNNLIIKSTSELLQQELSNLFKNLATSRGGLGSMISNLFSGIFGGGLGARARGGVEMPWRNFVAGEEGPEIISQDGPSGARRVTTAGQTRAKRGSGAMQAGLSIRNEVNIRVINNSNESVQTRKSQGIGGQELVDIIVGRVEERMARGELSPTLSSLYGLRETPNRR